MSSAESSSGSIRNTSGSNKNCDDGYQELSYEQLRDIRDILKRPLHNREVLIPFGTKAFIFGTLQPKSTLTKSKIVSIDNHPTTTTITTTSTANDNDQQQQQLDEIVTVTVPNNFSSSSDEIISSSTSDRTTLTESGSSSLVVVEMTRQEAIEYLDREMKELVLPTKPKPQPKNTITTTSIEKNQSSSSLPPKDANDESNDNNIKVENNNNNSNNNNKNNNNNNNTTTKSILKNNSSASTNYSAATNNNNEIISTAPLPSFFEIREDIDDEGNVKFGEAVNITNQLDYLQQRHGEGKPNNNDDNSIIMEPSAIAINDEINSDNDNKANSKSTIVSDNDSNYVPKKISSEEYNQLAVRLDELAKLEEASTKERTVNMKSSTKLQSKGWAKGFFNNNNNKTTNKKKSNTTTSNNNTQSSSKNIFDTTNNNNSTMQQKLKQSSSSILSNQEVSKVSQNNIATTTTSDIETSDTSNSVGKTVMFADQNEIQEIPRIGQRSIKAEQTLYKQQQQQQQIAKGVSSSPNVNKDENPVLREGFGSDVVAPTVMERKAVSSATTKFKKKTIKRTSVIPAPIVSPEDRDPIRQQPVAEKKVSKFVQERRMQHQQVQQRRER